MPTFHSNSLPPMILLVCIRFLLFIGSVRLHFLGDKKKTIDKTFCETSKTFLSLINNDKLLCDILSCICDILSCRLS